MILRVARGAEVNSPSPSTGEGRDGGGASTCASTAVPWCRPTLHQVPGRPLGLHLRGGGDPTIQRARFSAAYRGRLFVRLASLIAVVFVYLANDTAAQYLEPRNFSYASVAPRRLRSHLAI